MNKKKKNNGLQNITTIICVSTYMLASELKSLKLKTFFFFDHYWFMCRFSTIYIVYKQKINSINKSIFCYVTCLKPHTLLPKYWNDALKCCWSHWLFFAIALGRKVSFLSHFRYTQVTTFTLLSPPWYIIYWNKYNTCLY